MNELTILELVDLTKLLVGYNEFKYGILSQPLYETWADGSSKTFDEQMAHANYKPPPTPPPASDPQQQHPDQQQQHGDTTGAAFPWNKAFLSPAASSTAASTPGNSTPPPPAAAGPDPEPIELDEHIDSARFPSKVRQRKSSVVVTDGAYTGIAKPHAAHYHRYHRRSAMASGEAGYSRGSGVYRGDDDGDDDTELPVTLKRVITRRFSVSSRGSRT